MVFSDDGIEFENTDCSGLLLVAGDSDDGIEFVNNACPGLLVVDDAVDGEFASHDDNGDDNGLVFPKVVKGLMFENCVGFADVGFKFDKNVDSAFWNAGRIIAFNMELGIGGLNNGSNIGCCHGVGWFPLCGGAPVCCGNC